jgi:hypothetical protein
MHASTRLIMVAVSVKNAGIVADSLTGIHNAMVKCLFVVIRSCIDKAFSVSTNINP